MSNKNISLLMIAIAASLIISGCVEKNIPDNTVGIPAKTAKSVAEKIPAKNEVVPATVIVAPTPQAEQKIPASEEPKLTISSPEIVSQGENFAVILALEPHSSQKIVAVEANIASDDKVSVNNMEIISSNPEADRIIQERIISYANTAGITGDFATIKFSASQKGEAEIIVKATVVDENQLAAELIAKKIIKIV